MIFAAIATLSVLIGFLIGWVGRFTVFAATSLAIITVAVVVGLLGDSGLGETTLLAVVSFACLQIGYVGYICVGAIRLARSRQTDARQEASKDAPAKDGNTVPTYEQSR